MFVLNIKYSAACYRLDSFEVWYCCRSVVQL